MRKGGIMVKYQYVSMLKIYFKNSKYLEIIIDDMYNLQTFELWYMNNFKGVHKVESINKEIHYLKRDDILHVTCKQVFWDGQKCVKKEVI
jgi:hypothetical protein